MGGNVAGRLLRFDGMIAGAAFENGDRIVVGCWPHSPFGPFVDAMWARPDGTRMLVAPGGAPLAFVSSQYRFEERIATDTGASVSRRGLRFTGGPITLEMELAPPGAISALLGARPKALRAWAPWIWVEDVLVRPLVGPLLGGVADVRTRGVTAGGWLERYAVHDVRTAAHVRASADGVDLGAAVERKSPAGFGFSEFPPRAGAVRVTSLFEPRGADPELRSPPRPRGARGRSG